VLRANPRWRTGDPVLVPALPRRAASDSGPANKYRDLPRVADYHVENVRDGGDFIVAQDGATNQYDRRSSRYTLLRITMNAGQYEAFARRIDAADARSLETTPLSPPPPPAPLLPPSPSPPPTTPAPTSGDASRLDRLLDVSLFQATSKAIATSAALTTTIPRIAGPVGPTIKKQRVAYLFVLDEGWPDAASAKSAVSAIETFINSRRKRHNLDPIAVPVPDSFPSGSHAAYIADSLDHYAQTDPDRTVTTFYFPVVLRPETRPVLRAVLSETFLEEKLDPDVFDTKENQFDKEANADADKALTSWADKMASDRDTTDSWRINTPVLNFYYSLGDSLVISKTAFISSQSWAIRGRLFAVPHSQWNITVCAVGNNGLDLSTVDLDFAPRAANDDAYLAVMATDQNGDTKCGSNKWPTATLKTSFVVAYDGVTSKDCGTSYATPRVAWWLAAAVGSRTSPLPVNWRTSLLDVVCRIDSKRVSYRDIYFDPSVIPRWH